jgi:separase
LGHQLADWHIEAASSSIIVGLEKEFKLEISPALIKVILGGVVSVDEVQECVYQLMLYKGYFGWGKCCCKDRLRAFSFCQIVDKDLETLRCLIKDATKELPEPVHRGPVIFVLDINVQVSKHGSLYQLFFLVILYVYVLLGFLCLNC